MDIVTLPDVRPTRVRYLIIAILFAVSCFSFGDRVALSLAEKAQIDHRMMGALRGQRARHMSILNVGFAAAVPGLCGGFGGILGGALSDKPLHRGHSLSFARKAPIMAGMALSMTMIACNYAQAQSIMLLFMSIAFFRKGVGVLGWTLISDTSPKGMVGMKLRWKHGWHHDADYYRISGREDRLFQ
jgi:hypothetical protein